MAENESEVKRIKPAAGNPTDIKRDPSMTGGEKMETPQERSEREQQKAEPKEAPIIQKTPG